MAGHSKWANIKHTKAREDKKRGKIFTKLIRQVQVAARLGGGDPAANPRLRSAVSDALAANMPRNTIERAIKRGSGDDDSAQLSEIRYEGYGPAGIALIIDCLTDNTNRSVAEVRHALTKAGGNLGTNGSVAYLFNKRGLLCFGSDIQEDDIMEAAIEAGADDVVVNDDGSIDVFTQPTDFIAVKEALQSAGFQSNTAELAMIAETLVDVEEEAGVKLLKLIDRLDDLDDVQQVTCNANITKSIAKAYEKECG